MEQKVAVQTFFHTSHMVLNTAQTLFGLVIWCIKTYGNAHQNNTLLSAIHAHPLPLLQGMPLLGTDIFPFMPHPASAEESCIGGT